MCSGTEVCGAQGGAGGSRGWGAGPWRVAHGEQRRRWVVRKGSRVSPHDWLPYAMVKPSDRDSMELSLSAMGTQPSLCGEGKTDRAASANSSHPGCPSGWRLGQPASPSPTTGFFKPWKLQRFPRAALRFLGTGLSATLAQGSASLVHADHAHRPPDPQGGCRVQAAADVS